MGGWVRSLERQLTGEPKGSSRAEQDDAARREPRHQRSRGSAWGRTGTVGRGGEGPKQTPCQLVDGRLRCLVVSCSFERQSSSILQAAADPARLLNAVHDADPWADGADPWSDSLRACRNPHTASPSHQQGHGAGAKRDAVEEARCGERWLSDALCVSEPVFSWCIVSE